MRSLFLVGLAALALASLAIAAAMSEGQANASEPVLRTVRGGTPVELCVQADDQAASGLAAGRRRPVLAVMSYDPPPEGPAGIDVTSSATGKTSRIGIFPGEPFAASGPAAARRFYLPSVGGDRATTECFTVKLPAGGGAATVMLEISPPSPN